ncbi:MAG: PQQ-binding-like beta-propeller repeat protein [Phycisphaerales bacterium]|nr:PQQ-binding-like beta-propeller repeat protein [Phycisphaerales bacterium]
MGKIIHSALVFGALAVLLTSVHLFAEDTGKNYPQYRGGPARDAIARGETGLAKSWGERQPKQLWKNEMYEGYSGPVINDGKIYIMDYEPGPEKPGVDPKIAARQGTDLLQCLDLDTGKKFWEYRHPTDHTKNAKARPNEYGITRTTPAVTDKFAVFMTTEAEVICLDAQTGALAWQKNLITDYGTPYVEYYMCQNPLIDGDKVIVAPAGKGALMVAYDLATGEVKWTTPNTTNARLSHNSITAMDYKGTRIYLYVSHSGFHGVSADGKAMFFYPEWKAKGQNIPTPLVIGEDKIFVTGGYTVGSALLQLEGSPPGEMTVKEVYTRTEDEFATVMHPPILYNGFLYANHMYKDYVCMDLETNIKWRYGKDQSKTSFGGSPSLVADGMIYLVSENGTLLLIEPSPDKIIIKGQTKLVVSKKSLVRAPMAISNGKLLVRGYAEMYCLDVK